MREKSIICEKKIPETSEPQSIQGFKLTIEVFSQDKNVVDHLGAEITRDLQKFRIDSGDKSLLFAQFTKEGSLAELWMSKPYEYLKNE